MSTKSVIIAGTSFVLSAPYVEGHTLNAAEAHVLNQVRHENVRNNTAKKVKELSPEEAAAYVANYDAEYVFTLSSGSSVVKLDPVEREARKIAKDIIKEHLAKSGRSISKTPAGIDEQAWKDKIEENIAAIAAKPEVVKEARKNIDAQTKRIEKLSEGLDLG